MAEKDAQLSQRQLAKETGLSPTTINKLFTNKFERVDTRTVETLCDYFKTDIGELFVLRDMTATPWTNFNYGQLPQLVVLFIAIS